MSRDYNNRLRRLERKRRLSGSNPIAEALKQLPAERLERLLKRDRTVSQVEAEKIRRFAIEATLNPNAPIADEFMTLPFVREYMKKRET